MSGKDAQSKAIDAIVKVGSRADMAQMLGVSLTMVDNLTAEGKLIKLRPGVFDIVESVRTYCAHLRSAAAGRSESDDDNFNLTKSRAKLAEAQAEAQEFKNEILRGEHVPAADVERVWADSLRTLRSRIMAVPSRVRQVIPGLGASDVEKIDRELRDALEEVARGGD